MSIVKFRAQPLSRRAIRKYAKKLRSSLGLEHQKYIDIVYLAEVVFPAIFARYHYGFEVMSVNEMGANHGLTNPDTGKVMIREDIYNRACQGKGRDRLTIAHELGHFLLHDGVTIGLARAGENEKIPTYCDPEWQATVFAAEFLMDSDLIRNMSPEQISRECGVSFSAARFQWDKLR